MYALVMGSKVLHLFPLYLCVDMCTCSMCTHMSNIKLRKFDCPLLPHRNLSLGVLAQPLLPICCRYAFVRFQRVDEARAAIASLHGSMVAGHMLQVKFADADAGPPLTNLLCGQTPSDSCYVKHLPPSFGVRPCTIGWICVSSAHCHWPQD
jgi:hypothetical protein